MAEQKFKANPAMVEKYLAGVDYPASRQDLIKKAKDNKASEDIIDTISSLPEKTFNSPIDISKAMSKSSVQSAKSSTGEKVGLAAASPETRERVAHMGGEAPHEQRGLQAASQETRERVAKMGGEAPHEQRGLQAASQETRERVAHLGGEASVSTKTAVSAAEVQKFLKGMDYPAGKKEIVSQAKKNKAPKAVLGVLNKIDDQQFNSTTDVSKAIGKIL
jgi:hypothetical protein